MVSNGKVGQSETQGDQGAPIEELTGKEFCPEAQDCLFRIIIIPLLPRLDFADSHLLSEWRVGWKSETGKTSLEAGQEDLQES